MVLTRVFANFLVTVAKQIFNILLPIMLNILDFADDLSNDLKLRDGIWQFASACDLNTNSIFWNRAALITISKKYTTEPSSALIYLLQKEAKTLALWQEEWGSSTPTAVDFLRCLSAWGRFTNTVGYSIPIEKFWISYNATIEGIITQPSFEFCEEGTARPYTRHLVKEDIEQVICFDDTWNEQNFLIESSTEWILFSWETMA